jgi:Protein of unknown function (DUF3047)
VIRSGRTSGDVTPRRWQVGAVAPLALAATLAGADLAAPRHASIRLDALEESRVGSTLPAGWESRPVRGARRPSSAVVPDPQWSRALRFEADNAAGWFWRRLPAPIDPNAGTLTWRWRVDVPLATTDLRQRARDDSPARFFVVFGRRGPLSRPRILFYTWGRAEHVGDSWRSRVSDRFGIVVLRNAQDPIGEWVAERRDLAADYRRVFGGQPERVAAVGVLVDAEQTRGHAVSLLGPVTWEAVMSMSLRQQ